MAYTREHGRAKTSENVRSGAAEKVRSTKTGQFVKVHSGANVAEVPVSKARFKGIVTKRGALDNLIAVYADTATKAKRTGQTFLVTYAIRPDGRAEAISKAPAEKIGGEALSAAIARAKTRGATKIAQILKGEDMLTGRHFGELIGASHETVNAKRKRDEILGLEGATRGVKYPRWQVTDYGRPLPGLPRLFGVLGKRPWTVFRFLLAEHGELGGRTALDALKSGQVDAVIGVAENLAASAFG